MTQSRAIKSVENFRSSPPKEPQRAKTYRICGALAQAVELPALAIFLPVTGDPPENLDFFVRIFGDTSKVSRGPFTVGRR
eukprot:4649614-Amphidinium_carterae.1